MDASKSVSLQYLISGISGEVIINSPLLQNGYFPKDNNTGTALWLEGKTAAVFPYLLNKQRKAIKIWYSQEATIGKKEQYQNIQSLYNDVSLPYFSAAQYIPEAISINHTPHDVLLMDWVGRQNIKEYVIANVNEPDKLDSLAAKLLELHQDLNERGIAHGHLTTNNIYVDANDQLQLIDYDTLFIRATTAEDKIATAFADYAHPSQKRVTLLNEKADYFSMLVIYIGVKALAKNPSLWGRYAVGTTDNFIFKQADFLNITSSQAYADIRKIDTVDILELLHVLQLYCETKNILELAPFYTYLPSAMASTPTPADAAISMPTLSLVVAPTAPLPMRMVHKAVPLSNTVDAKKSSKKVSIILPVKETAEESIDAPFVEIISPLETNAPAATATNTEVPPTTTEKKLFTPYDASADLSNVWIHQSDDAGSTISKVFGTTSKPNSFSTSNDPVNFSDATTIKTALEEKLLVNEMMSELHNRKNGKKRHAAIGFATATLLVGAMVGVYFTHATGVYWGAKRNHVANTTLIVKAMPAEASGASATDSSIQTTDITTVAEEATTIPAVTTTTENKKEEKASMLGVANKENTRKEKEEQKPVAAIDNSKNEKEKQPVKTVATEKVDTDDILTDENPSKGFNTGIQTKKQ
jgi:hypothetical protein